jgi:carboxylesterase
LIEGGEELAPGVGSDIAQEGSVELAYAELPLRAARSLFGAATGIAAGLGSLRCPILLFSSIQDHVVAPVSGDRLVGGAAGPVERIVLERSFHVATLDYDKEEIEKRTVAFVTDLLPPPGA